MSDYLWDKSGEAPPDVERLEELLGRMRHAGRAPELPFEIEPRASALELERHASTRARFFSLSGFSHPARLAAAAALLLAVLAGAFAMMRTLKRDDTRASVNNETKVAQPQPSAAVEARPREERRAPEVAVSPPKESSTPEKLQREPAPRNMLAVEKMLPKSQRRESAPRETAASGTTPRVVKPAVARGEVFDGGATGIDERVRAKEQLVYALRLTSEALKEVRGRAKGVAATNSFDGRTPLK